MLDYQSANEETKISYFDVALLLCLLAPTIYCIVYIISKTFN